MIAATVNRPIFDLDWRETRQHKRIPHAKLCKIQFQGTIRA